MHKDAWKGHVIVQESGSFGAQPRSTLCSRRCPFPGSSLFRKDSDHVTHGPSMPFPLSSEKAHVSSEWLQFRQGRQEYFSTLIRGTLALLSRPHHGVTAPHSAQRFSSAFERLLRIPQPILKMAKSLPGPLALIRTQGLSARLI